MAKGTICVILFSVIALACSLTGTIWCRMVDFESIGTFRLQYPQVYFGLWSQIETTVTISSSIITASDTCSPYGDDINIDTKWKSARAFSILAPVLGFLLVGMSFFVSGNSYKMVGAMVMVLVTMFQGLTLLFLRSTACSEWPIRSGIIGNTILSRAYSNGCEIGEGGYITIASTLFWFLTGIVMISCAPPEGEK